MDIETNFEMLAGPISWILNNILTLCTLTLQSRVESSNPVFIKHRPKTSSGSKALGYASQYQPKQRPNSQPAGVRSKPKGLEQRAQISSRKGTKKQTQIAAGRASNAASSSSALQEIIKEREYANNTVDTNISKSAPKTITIVSKTTRRKGYFLALLCTPRLQRHDCVPCTYTQFVEGRTATCCRGQSKRGGQKVERNPSCPIKSEASGDYTFPKTAIICFKCADSFPKFPYYW